jgi:hypothetical protein
MNIVNRGFISIKPTKEFLNWKTAHSDEEIIEPDNAEPSVYLIEDDFWDEEEILNKYFKKIAKQEFLGISESNLVYPSIDTIEDFSKYFVTEFGTFVFDLLKTPISSGKFEM